MTHSLHEKIFLVDGEVAIIGGRNVSDSSFNGKDLEVKMQGEVVGQIQDHFKIMFDFLLDMKVKSQCMMSENDSCEKSLNNLKFSSDNLDFFPKQTVFEDGEEARLLSHEAVIHHFQKKMNREERLKQRDDILDTVINIPFKTLKAYQYFMMPTERFKNYLNQNLEAGNKIEIITNSLESGKFSSNSGYIDFVEKGMEVYQWERNQKLHYVHEKVLIFDNEQIVIGSHNFVTGSTGVSNEIAVQIKSKNLAEKLTKVFDEEKNNYTITRKVESSFLRNEMNELKKKIKFFRGKLVKGVLREIY
jgi:cardiolipin synthase C